MMRCSIDALDWKEIERQLDAEGHALLPRLLGEEPIAIEAAPTRLSAMGPALYRHLAQIANRWNEMLGLEVRFADELEAHWRERTWAGEAASGPQARVTHLRHQELVALHHGAVSDLAFPFQIVALLSRPGLDFTGGELITTEQRPRMQSRPSVVPLQFGDAAILCGHQRPIEGGQGVYRVTMRHAIGRIRQGERVGLEMSFHAYAPPP